MKKITLLLTPLFALSFLVGCDKGSQKSFTITWANYDGTVLSTTTVRKGVVPTYDKEEPTRPEDEIGIRYTFSGWSPEVVAANKSTTYIAAYSETYKITFDAETGVFSTGKQKIVWCERGETPVCDEEPFLDGAILYKFAGWSKKIVPATEPAIYTATYGAQASHYHLKLTYKYGAGDLAKVGFKYEGDILSVNWGDSTINSESSHTYTGESETYTIEIKGNFKKFVLHNGFGHLLVQPGNANITEVEFVEDGNESVQGCVKLDDYVFYQCKSLKKIVLPSTLRWFGINPFGGCESIESLTIKEGGVLIDGGVNAIINKGSKILTLGTVATNNISSNENIRSIAPYAFDAIKKFFGIRVDCKLDSIETYAFYDCRNIVIYLDQHVDEMKNNIFRKFNVFDNISVGLGESEEDAKAYPKNAFNGASSITYKCTGYNLENDVLYIRDNQDGNEVARVITGNRGNLESKGSVTILSMVEGTTTNQSIPVVEISDNAFNGFNGIHAVNFSSDCQIETFGSSAFAECGLESVVIPNSVKTIKNNCFFAGPQFGEFTSCVTYYVPNTVVNIEERAFYFTENMDYATINCQPESKPEGWNDLWWDLALDAPTHCEVTVNWNVAPSSF